MPPSANKLLEIVAGETVLYTVPLLVKLLPPSLSTVAPNTAEVLVIEVTVGTDNEGAAPAVVEALTVGADAVK